MRQVIYHIMYIGIQSMQKISPKWTPVKEQAAKLVSHFFYSSYILVTMGTRRISKLHKVYSRKAIACRLLKWCHSQHVQTEDWYKAHIINITDCVISKHKYISTINSSLGYRKSSTLFSTWTGSHYGRPLLLCSKQRSMYPTVYHMLSCQGWVYLWKMVSGLFCCF